MRKVLLMMLLFSASGGAAAKWVAIDEIETGSATMYFDPTTLLKAGNTVKMWSLDDYNTFQFSQFGAASEPYLSTSHQYEYDCKANRRRRSAFSFHSGNMAKGKVISRVPGTGNWTPIASLSVDETLWKLACGKP